MAVRWPQSLRNCWTRWRAVGSEPGCGAEEPATTDSANAEPA